MQLTSLLATNAQADKQSSITNALVKQTSRAQIQHHELRLRLRPRLTCHALEAASRTKTKTSRAASRTEEGAHHALEAGAKMETRLVVRPHLLRQLHLVRPHLQDLLTAPRSRRTSPRSSLQVEGDEERQRSSPPSSSKRRRPPSSSRRRPPRAHAPPAPAHGDVLPLQNHPATQLLSLLLAAATPPLQKNHL